jgi:hypothetical protein
MFVRPVIGGGSAALNVGLWVFPDIKARNLDRRIIVLLTTVNQFSDLQAR